MARRAPKADRIHWLSKPLIVILALLMFSMFPLLGRTVAESTCVSPPSGLVSWWPGDGNAEDIAGSNHGTLVGAGFASGRVGPAFAFDGLDDYMSLPQRPVPDVLASQFTIEFWANPGAIPDRPTFGFLGSGISILLNPLVSYDGGLLVSDTRIFQSLPRLPVAPANSWTHYAIVDDGSFYRLYVNGVEQDNAAVGVHPSNPLDRSFVLGQSGFDEPYANPYQGRIDEFTIYSIGLSPAQIAGIANAGSAGKCRNTAPSISSFSATAATEGSPVTLGVAASDADGDVLTYYFDIDADGDFEFIGPSSTATFTWGDDHVGGARVVVTDGLLEAESGTSLTVTNVAPSVTVVASAAEIAEGQTLTLSYRIVDPGSDDLVASITWQDGTAETRAYPLGPAPDPSESTDVAPRDESDTVSHAYRDNGLFLVTVTACDDDGGCGSASVSINVLNLPPVVSITGPASGSLFAVGTAITFSGTFTDAGLADVHTATWVIDSMSIPGTVTQGDGTGTVLDTIAFAAPGVYPIAFQVVDDDAGVGTASTVGELAAFVVIFNPEAGFVTGGGWIESPAGAYAPDPMLAGRAVFGFVARYQKGADVPIGETEFQFRVADLNFHSTSYDWLVVSNARAQYKGSGTINGLGDYDFLVTAIDGNLLGSGGSDRFRIKIWDRVTGQVIYDSQMGLDDFADPTNGIGSGSVVIHKG